MLTIRPRLGPGAWVLLALLAGMFVASVVYWPRQAPWLVSCAMLMVVIGWVRLRAVRLEITDATVRVKRDWFRPGKEAARSDITSIHYFPGLISFRGPDNKPIIKAGPDWTLRQMLEVARELRVPLYDHKRWLGMRKVRIGRLAYDPIRNP